MNVVQTWHTRWLIGVLAALFLLIQPSAGFGQATPVVETSFRPGEVLVGIRSDGVRAAALLATLGADVIDTLDLRGLDGGVGDGGVSGYRLQVKAGSEWTIIEQLLQDPTVAFAEPNWIVRAAELTATTAEAKPETPFVVNDPSYAAQQWYLPRINASRAWGLAYSADGFAGNLATIRVAIVDSGIDVDHPEFQGMLLPGKNYASDDPTAAPIDKFGHGTHVAGLVGAITNNGIGIAGVAPKIEIDPRKVLNDSGTGSISDLADGIRDAADNDAHIINLSVELYVASTTLQTAVQYAAGQGALLIAAAGNQARTEAAYPARYDEVLAVAATTYEDRRPSYSNTGSQIDIAAPGGVSIKPIYSTWSNQASCRDVKPPDDPKNHGGYCTAEGTSMAAGIVSGAAAMLWSLNPALTAQEVRALLLETATPITATPAEVGSGRLDIHAALRKLLPKALQPSQTQIAERVALAASPYTRTIRLENPSLNPLTWEASLINAPTWITLPHATSGTVTGAARYGEPGHVQMVITPTALAVGNYSVTLRVVGNLGDGNSTIQDVQVIVNVGDQPHRFFFPLVIEGVPRPPVGSFQWEVPSSGSARTILADLNDDNSLGITLPFDPPLQGSTDRNARVYANGFVTFPDVEVTGDLPNVCLPDSGQPPQAIYGWWANLNPGAAGAQVSTFQAAPDRFVIEFANVPTAAAATSAYTVSFQIVLYASGDIGLNYAQTPDPQTIQAPVTVAVEAFDGLFYNQIACKDATTELGYLPHSRQSFLLQAEEGVY